MWISHKSNVIQAIEDTEWECRKNTKGQTPAEYFSWLDSVTTVTGDLGNEEKTIDYSGETGYTIVRCEDEDVKTRLEKLNEYISFDDDYNIKYYASKRDAEEILDDEGNSHDPKQYVQSHFVGQDDTKDARLLADEWTRIRRERDRLLTESDWTQGNDSPLSESKKTEWGTYRTSLRDLPSNHSGFSDPKTDIITWPTKPS